MCLHKYSCTYTGIVRRNRKRAKMNNLKEWFAPLPEGAKTKWLEGRPKFEGESELIKAWKGLTPRGVAKEMATEYVRRFPSPILPEQLSSTGTEDSLCIWHKWIALKHNTWVDLEHKLKHAARACRARDQDLFYWDRMRSIFLELPNLTSRRIKRSVSHALQNQDIEIANPIEELCVCRLCWRAAPKRRGDPWAYCQLSSSDFEDYELSKEHNKRRRLQHSKLVRPHSVPIFTAKNDPLFVELNPSRVVRVKEDKANTDNVNNSFELTLDKLWLSSPALIIRQLPHVYEHLKRNNADMMCTRSIIHTLESPAPLKESEKAKSIRKRFYEDCVFYYYLYFPHLVWAEIWLRYEAGQSKHGGARRGAGRHRKETAEATLTLEESSLE